ncbi:hypothetical protein, partial [Clostridium perfringens]|uniref:hypothetical protein n=1 Tax=Clostridium perfringens TaxID=1502 RepID=UPI0037542D97
MPSTSVWSDGTLIAISSSIDAEYRGLVCPHNHLSISVVGQGRRPSDDEMAAAREAFDMVDAEEDNHSPGVARHLFLPLHLPRGVVGV